MPTTLIYDSIIALVAASVPAYFAWSIVRRRRHAPVLWPYGSMVLDTLLAAVWIVVMYGSFIEPKLLAMRTTDVRLDEIKDNRQKTGETGGSRVLVVALISDSHLGQYRHAEWLAQVVARINTVHPDVVVLDGDIVSNLSGLQDFASLRDLKSRFGTYAVLGNWDYGVGAIDVRKRIESFKTQMLVNRSVQLDVDGQTVSIIGLDDVMYGHPDFDLAMKDVPPGAKTILLAHNPDAARQAETYGIDLVLSGHTHAGQIRLPFIGAVPKLPTHIGQQFDEGLFSFGQTRLFITPGVGESGPRARLFDPPEISILRITF